MAGVGCAWDKLEGDGGNGYDKYIAYMYELSKIEK